MDHLPLWVALGATLSTGIHEPGESAVMALPLVAAAAVERSRRDLGPYHRWLEVGALLFFLGDLARGQGVFPVAIHTLFVLAGVRLALPRDTRQRRQLVLMGFLLLLTTTVSTTDPVFLAWAVAWFTAAALALLQLSWEASALLRRGALIRPPYARVPIWAGAALVIGSGFFLVMPRIQAGIRPTFLGTPGAFGRAGLGDQVDLGVGGPIEANPEVALRIVPPPGTAPASLEGLDLLPGVTLEAVQGQRWFPSDLTPPSRRSRQGGTGFQAEFLYTPSPHGILALPYGLISLAPPGLPIRPGEGASRRWMFPRARTVPMGITWNPREAVQAEPRLPPRRLELLTFLEPEHAAARRWSLRLAPGIRPTPELARTLETALRGFRYTLDNPSGRAANPLEDFLDQTQAGHCEYFASAMALMLRARGVPARVVNGYRLGPWIPEGGYFRVSQDQAHSWVEYWDEGRWQRSDPTPAAPAGSGPSDSGLGTASRWLDALRYRWDRYVVRFSDQDQQAGFAWFQGRWKDWEWRWKTPPAPLSWGAGLLVLAWVAWRTRDHWRPVPKGPGRIRALRPLLVRVRRSAPPQAGDTARAWLMRLGDLRPERRAPLRCLADAVDADAYGHGGDAASPLAKAEAAAWRGWKATS
ncbi:MAG: transglutaminaseTgpA domain-containing protein [Geothrix sp.]|nr:transglutaminaseTgpA domain-containing protein [Geothrix sp.]